MPGMKYDDAQYNVIHRKWFGLTPKWGGDAAAGFTDLATTDATSGTLITGWYPRGGIEFKKFGGFVLATLTQATSDLVPIYLKTRGASGSAGCTLNIKSTATAKSQKTFASTVTFTVNQCKAGEYIYVRYGTPKTDKGTAANTASMTGTFALFLDYSPRYRYDSDA